MPSQFPETSIEAYERFKASGKLNKHRRWTLWAITQWPSCDAHQLARRLSRSRRVAVLGVELTDVQLRKRISELHHDEMIYRDGKTKNGWTYRIKTRDHVPQQLELTDA